MHKPALLLFICVAVLAGCAEEAQHPVANIGNVVEVKSMFGPEFAVTDVPVTGIDPALLSAQKLPEGVAFDPADCAKFAAGPQFPVGVKGNMAAVQAEGEGNRLIAIALETSEPIPVDTPGENCRKVTFSGDDVRGSIQAVDAPHIDDVQTQGVHRVLQATVEGKPQTGEIYSYRASFGNYQVIVTANPLVVPGKPVVPVDTERATRMLSEAVAAIKD